MAGVGIKIENCLGGQIIGGSFHGLDIGIDVSDSRDVNVNGVLFDGVSTGLKARNVSNLKAMNCADTKKSAFKLSPIAKLVWWYIEMLKRG